MKKYIFFTLCFFALLITLSFKQNQAPEVALNYPQFGLLPVPQGTNRTPASLKSQGTPDVASRVGNSSSNPPIISPDNPVQPRRSSREANDPPIANLFNFFNLNLVNQPTLPQALCNDGTKPAYYIKKGFGAGANRWVIWLEGGGGCGSDDPMNPLWCGVRKNTLLATSNGLPSALGDLQGILSKSDVYNSDFYSYNQVLVHYCSSDFWGGRGEQKIMNKDTGEKWWFSGKKIVEAVVLDLKQKHNFTNATNVILSGSSAGGAGITMNADEIKSKIPNADVITNIDATNIIPFYRYFKSTVPEDQREYISEPEVFKQCYQFLPMEGNVNCLRNKPKCPINARCLNTSYLCMLPGFAAKYLSMPVFISSDQLDNSLLAMYSLSLCSEQNEDEYGEWLDSFTQDNINAAKTVSGYFLPRTGDHGLSVTHHWTTAVVENGVNVRLKDVFGAWYFNRTSSPKRFIQSPSLTLHPHEESSPGLCTAARKRVKN